MLGLLFLKFSECFVKNKLCQNSPTVKPGNVESKEQVLNLRGTMGEGLGARGGPRREQ